jgi:4-hydroxy-tetrahydrodipicolinate reductase
MMTDTDLKMVVVAGAAGRMGQTLLKAIHAAPGMKIHAALEREGSPALGKDAGELCGIGPIGVPVTSDPLQAFLHADAVIDFTSPASTIEFAGLAAQARIVHVIGTTGCSADDIEKIKAASRHARIVMSGNMSLGVNLLAVLVRRAAAALEAANWDIEVLEMHHNKKVDAPSGTALLLGAEAARGRGIDLLSNAVKVRDGHTGPREPGSIGFATLRGGGVVGDHSVMFAGESEMITLSHRATDRSLFAQGALAAARWAQDRKPGFYNMLDVLGLND